jgi:hypothetical protein
MKILKKKTNRIPILLKNILGKTLLRLRMYALCAIHVELVPFYRNGKNIFQYITKLVLSFTWHSTKTSAFGSNIKLSDTDLHNKTN